MAKLKIGDQFQYTQAMEDAKRHERCNGANQLLIGKIVTVKNIKSCNANACGITESYDLVESGNNFHCNIIDPFLSTPLTPKTFMSNFLEKAALAFKSEPEKSFRKAGVTNGDDLFTEEGAKLFLTWLSKQDCQKLAAHKGSIQDKFREDVVDKILEEQKESK